MGIDKAGLFWVMFIFFSGVTGLGVLINHDINKKRYEEKYQEIKRISAGPDFIWTQKEKKDLLNAIGYSDIVLEPDAEIDLIREDEFIKVIDKNNSLARYPFSRYVDNQNNSLARIPLSKFDGYLNK